MASEWLICNLCLSFAIFLVLMTNVRQKHGLLTKVKNSLNVNFSLFVWVLDLKIVLNCAWRYINHANEARWNSCYVTNLVPRAFPSFFEGKALGTRLATSRDPLKQVRSFLEGKYACSWNLKASSVLPVSNKMTSWKWLNYSQLTYKFQYIVTHK